MTYSEAINFLYELRLFGTKLGLENTFGLAKLCGNPQEALKFIHVAGTNGKGSVCAMLESIYRQAGLRVGLFTSPHLVSFTERIQVCRQPIAEEEVSRLVDLLLSRLGSDAANWPFRPTFFEFVTVLALLYFQEQRCDLVIWETGMGGRLDATNIVSPLASIITNIQFDHEHWLGHTLAEIAREKAGIIKRGVPCITGVEPGEALDVIRETARLNDSALRVVTQPFSDSRIDRLSLLGDHQKTNAMIAVAAVDALHKTVPVSNEAIERGLANTSWPGRLQLLQRANTLFLLDGAHNADGAKTLTRALERHFFGRPVTLIIGVFKDKAWQAMCRHLVPHAVRVFLVPIQSERSAAPEEVREFCVREWPLVEARTFASCPEAIDAAKSYPFVVVAGSLHLVGEALEHLGFTSMRPERELNEWDAARDASSLRT